MIMYEGGLKSKVQFSINQMELNTMKAVDIKQLGMWNTSCNGWNGLVTYVHMSICGHNWMTRGYTATFLNLLNEYIDVVMLYFHIQFDYNKLKLSIQWNKQKSFQIMIEWFVFFTAYQSNFSADLTDHDSYMIRYTSYI